MNCNMAARLTNERASRLAMRITIAEGSVHPLGVVVRYPDAHPPFEGDP
jgi:hypothetical protein